MHIRRFISSDAESLAALYHASVRLGGLIDYSMAQVEAWSPAPPDPERYHRLASRRLILVAIDEEGQIAGYGELEQNGHIDHLYCRPNRIGSGVGRALCDALERAARNERMSMLSVEASEAARRLFERQGFRVDERNDFLLRGVPLHNYRMSKRLD
ncbi:GNAT family N-acetyltransferase [Stenotrophomonas geniculata]|uniref:GNAT family N-acetyltransferase n=1 Tax=Stenotrophomonas geniculata TaxID=86188 RepID=UPI003AAED4A1